VLENAVLDHPRHLTGRQADPRRNVRRVRHWANLKVRLKRFLKLIAQYSTQSFDRVSVFLELASDSPAKNMHIFLKDNLLVRMEVEGGRDQSVRCPLHNLSLFRFAQGVSHGSL
jgi:hypothetical protein